MKHHVFKLLFNQIEYLGHETSKSGLTDLKPPHLDSTDRNTLPCWECTNCETLEALSASVVLSFSHLCPNLWHTDLPCTAVCYLTLNCHVGHLMTGCCCSQSWAEMWGMRVCSTTTEWGRTTNRPRVPLVLLEWEEFNSISNDAILQSFP